MIFSSAITPSEMNEIETRSEKMGVPKSLLMENAGKAIADFIASKIDLSRKKVTVVTGTGNNGGDGFVAARHMEAYAAVIKVFLLGSDDDIKTDEAKWNFRIIKEMRSIELSTLPDGFFMDKLKRALSEAEIVVDAIFGIGINRELTEPYISVVEAINFSRAFKIAVDVPTGLDALTGKILGKSVKADATVTFHRIKKGLLNQGRLTGELVVANIGIPPKADLI